ncbi:adenine phosphoribosyltransferase 2 isoform X1 [Brassica napus]|uniref:adenine phosphoribosyltransferase 2 isoform X1 n=1 Tax=Brassica napus TaxID=3708 RepID=UPI000BBE2017|nr:adenine phosphoribosyltransferase 2 isoform X1 [Brassica napus]
MFAVENGLQGDPRLQTISDAIRVIPHFPKTGIMFQDITTLLLDPVAFKHVVDIFVDRYKHMNISLVAGVEARGFIFGPPIALAIGAKFVPLRKPGKLPGRVISEEYELEYGNDRLEMSMEAVKTHERALVIDDLVATGGTLSASINLLDIRLWKIDKTYTIIEFLLKAPNYTYFRASRGRSCGMCMRCWFA